MSKDNIQRDGGCSPTTCSVPVAERPRMQENDQFLCIEDGKCKEIPIFYALRRYDGQIFPERFLTPIEAYRERIKRLRGVPDDRIEVVQLAEFQRTERMSAHTDNERSEAGGCGAASCSAFEEWFEADAMPLEHSNWFRRGEDGDYEITAVLNAWEAWEAARRWIESRPREIICTKCGIRESRGELPTTEF